MWEWGWCGVLGGDAAAGGNVQVGDEIRERVGLKDEDDGDAMVELEDVGDGQDVLVCIFVDAFFAPAGEARGERRASM